MNPQICLIDKQKIILNKKMNFWRKPNQPPSTSFNSYQPSHVNFISPNQLGYGVSEIKQTNQYNDNQINTNAYYSPSFSSPQEIILFSNVAIISKKAQKVLDVCQDKEKRGMLIIYEDFNQANQRFDIIKCGDYVTIRNRQNGKTLTVAGNSQKNGAPIIQQPISGLVGQKFRLSLLQNGCYIIHTFCGKALDCCEEKTSNGTPVIQYKFDRKEHQMWRIK